MFFRKQEFKIKYVCRSRGDRRIEGVETVSILLSFILSFNLLSMAMGVGCQEIDS
jgi:hypothetical protein